LNIQYEINRVTNAAKLLSMKNDEWTKMIASLSTVEEKAAETELYNNVADGAEGLMAFWTIALETLDVWEMKYKETDRAIVRCSSLWCGTRAVGVSWVVMINDG
jgi:hypothetical protein